MSTVAARRRGTSVAEPKLRTIGAICDELREEFPDISVSRSATSRTRASSRRVARAAATALLTRGRRAPRHDPAPAAGRVPVRRVIRQELDGPGAGSDRARARGAGLTGHEEEIDASELCERASVSPEFLRQLEEYGVVVSRVEGGDHLYRESEADIAAASATGALRHRCAPPPRS